MLTLILQFTCIYCIYIITSRFSCSTTRYFSNRYIVDMPVLHTVMHYLFNSYDLDKYRQVLTKSYMQCRSFLWYLQVIFSPFHTQPGFDWGQVDTNALAKCLLTLCRELKDTLCLEPRLVKLKSPVYILGKKQHASICYKHCTSFKLICTQRFFSLCNWYR